MVMALVSSPTVTVTEPVFMAVSESPLMVELSPVIVLDWLCSCCGLLLTV
jgi:hypothetical protein